ncbi:MAG: hypothetical protein ACR2PI_20450 [Hyphomicrobiaceae bacterium]
MRASLPLTEKEISAERDRLRAENAIRVHQLTAKIEQARLFDARQKVEINRRDGTISALQRRLQQIETEREGSENARRVLEATITQRVPEIEARLMEARQLLAKRDAEMTTLQKDTGRTFRALDDAMQVNAQQRAEIDRLKVSLAGHGGRPHNAASGAETETAMRVELESYRLRSRDQAALIAKLRRELNGTQEGEHGAGNKDKSEEVRDEGAGLIPLKPAFANNDEGWDVPDLDQSEAILARQDEVGKLQVKLAEQSAKVEALSAQLANYENGGEDTNRSLSLRDTKSSLKARAAASEKELAARDKEIEGLRRELATANERIARQASHYQDELRRLGGGVKTGAPQSERVPTDKNERKGAQPAAQLGDNTDKVLETADAEPGLAAKSAVTGGDQKQSLEARLSAIDTEGNEASFDFDEHADASEPPRKRSRGKLMDRIAGLAKR